MREINCCVTTHPVRYAVLLGEHQSHDLAKLHVVEEKLDVYWIRGVFGWAVRTLIIHEVVLRYHLDVGVFDVDADWTTKRNRNRPVTSEQRPPDTLPETFVGF